MLPPSGLVSRNTSTAALVGHRGCTTLPASGAEPSTQLSQSVAKDTSVSKMPSKCYVKWCSSGYDSQIKENRVQNRKNNSLFRAPKDPDLRRKWSDAIGRTDKKLYASDSVCELHFADADVERYYETVMPDGTCHRIPKRSTLKPGAIPQAHLTLESPTDTTATVTESTNTLESREKSTENILQTVKQEDVTDEDSDSSMLPQQSQVPVPNLLIQPAATLSSSNQTCNAGSSKSSEYSMQNLRVDLKKFPLPEAWAYVFDNKEIHLHHWSPEFTTRMTVLIQGDMTAKILVCQHVARQADSMDLTSFDNITRSLHLLGKQKLCHGTGINGSRAESCYPFLSDCKSEFRRTYANKCLPCRILRKKVINADKKRKSIENKRITKLRATLKATKQKNLRLHKKTQRLKAEVDSVKKNVQL